MNTSFFGQKRALAGVTCMLVVGAMPALAEIKKTIAVAPVVWSAGAVSWISGEALQAQMITELNNSGRYRVVERENLQGMLAAVGGDGAGDGRS